MRNARKPRQLPLILTSLLLCLSLSGCDFQQEADQKFGDQHFKTAIALIELHKLRFDEYPDTLADLKFTGDWDQLALASVSYERINNGYSLDVTRGWVGEPELTYPEEFWQGLGLVRSNVKSP
ncbi:MAG: hypothetical protein AAGB19_17205 [Cyanobacteria bacterium P01_F01_bin.3]